MVSPQALDDERLNFPRISKLLCLRMRRAGPRVAAKLQCNPGIEVEAPAGLSLKMRLKNQLCQINLDELKAPPMFRMKLMLPTEMFSSLDPRC